MLIKPNTKALAHDKLQTLCLAITSWPWRIALEVLEISSQAQAEESVEAVRSSEAKGTLQFALHEFDADEDSAASQRGKLTLTSEYSCMLIPT